ncbi:hypothetical protein ACQKDD_18005 [Planococcus kocurii]|uniref:hypothetical protein n=1 Tax=Planococcus kocurii TaxID=1374 RepID=UPI003CFF0515
MKNLMNGLLKLIVTGIFFFVYLQIFSFVASNLYLDIPVLEMIIIGLLVIFAFATTAFLFRYRQPSSS